MKDHRITIIISKFDKVICKRFDLFLRSPYHNTSEKTLKLGQFFLAYYPSFSSSKFNEKEAFKVLFPDRAFSKHELNRYMSKVLSLLDKFAAHESLTHQPFLEASLTERYYFKFRDIHGFERAQKQTQKVLDKQVIKVSKSYYTAYQNRKWHHNASMYKTDKSNGQQSCLEALEALYYFFLIEMFQTGIALTYQYKTSPHNSYFPLISAGQGFVKENLETVPALVKLWYHAFNLSQSLTDITYFKLMKSCLKLHVKQISAMDARSFSVLLISALKAQINQGRTRYLEERFDIHLLEIQEKWIIAKNVLNYTTFNNIILEALALGHIDWAQDFINSHQHYLPDDVRTPIVHYNSAQILFANKDYEQCLEALSSIPFLDTSVTLGIKRLQIKCLFELQEYDKLFTSLHAMTMYIHRMDTKLTRAKEVNNQFVKVVKLLYNALENPDQESAEAFTEIRSIVQANPLLPEAEWVLTYLEER